MIIFCAVVCFLLTGGGGGGSLSKAQNVYGIESAEVLLSRLQTNRIAFDYSCVLSGDVLIEFKGDVLAQENCYNADVNGTRIICNGSVRWSIDSESKEIYIESVSENDIENLIKYRNDFKEFRFDNIRYMPLSDDLSDFSFDVSSLNPKEWVVVDLRK